MTPTGCRTIKITWRQIPSAPPPLCAPPPPPQGKTVPPPPPPHHPGGWLSRDGPPHNPGEPYYHRARTLLGTEIAAENGTTKHKKEYPMTCGRAGSPVERMNTALVTGVNMVVLSSSISEKGIQNVLPKYSGYKWQCLTTH